MDGERSGHTPPPTGDDSPPPSTQRFAARLQLPAPAVPPPVDAAEQTRQLELRAQQLRHAERALTARTQLKHPHRPRTRSAATNSTPPRLSPPESLPDSAPEAPSGPVSASRPSVPPTPPPSPCTGEGSASQVVAVPKPEVAQESEVTQAPAPVTSVPPTAPTPCVRPGPSTPTLQEAPPSSPHAADAQGEPLAPSQTLTPEPSGTFTLVCTCRDVRECTCEQPDSATCTCAEVADCSCTTPEATCSCLPAEQCLCDANAQAVTPEENTDPLPVITTPPAPLSPTEKPQPQGAQDTGTTTKSPAHPSEVEEVLSDSAFTPWPRRVTWGGVALLTVAAAAAAPLSRNRQWRPVCPDQASECLNASDALWMNILWGVGLLGLALVAAGVVATSWWLYRIASSATRAASTVEPQYALVGGVTWLLHTVLIYLCLPFAFMGWLVSNLGLVAASTMGALAHGLLLERTLKSDIVRLSPGSAHTLAAATTALTGVLGWLVTSRGFPLWLLAPVAGLGFAGAALCAHWATHRVTRPVWATRTTLLRGAVCAACALTALAIPVLVWMSGTSGRLIGAPGWTSSTKAAAGVKPSVSAAPSTSAAPSASAPPTFGKATACPLSAVAMDTLTWNTTGSRHTVTVRVRNTSATVCSITATPTASLKITGRRAAVATSGTAGSGIIDLQPGGSRVTTISWSPQPSGTMSTQYFYLSIGNQPEPVPVRLTRWPHPFDVVIGSTFTATPWR